MPRIRSREELPPLMATGGNRLPPVVTDGFSASELLDGIR